MDHMGSGHESAKDSDDSVPLSWNPKFAIWNPKFAIWNPKFAKGSCSFISSTLGRLFSKRPFDSPNGGHLYNP